MLSSPSCQSEWESSNESSDWAGRGGAADRMTTETEDETMKLDRLNEKFDEQ